MRGQDTPSAALLAMASTPEVALGAVRLSMGHGTTAAAADIHSAIRILTQGYGDCTPAPRPVR